MKIDEQGTFEFNGKKFEFLKKKTNNYYHVSFLLSEDKLSELKELKDIIGELAFRKHNHSILRVTNCMILDIYELSDIYGFIEVKFRTYIPKSEIREIKLQKLFK